MIVCIIPKARVMLRSIHVTPIMSSNAMLSQLFTFDSGDTLTVYDIFCDRPQSNSDSIYMNSQWNFTVSPYTTLVGVPM